jgi:hypothetical protein
VVIVVDPVQERKVHFMPHTDVAAAMLALVVDLVVTVLLAPIRFMAVVVLAAIQDQVVTVVTETDPVLLL